MPFITIPRLTKETFTSSGTWTCPPGVTSVLLFGCGGGGGGGRGGMPGSLVGGGGWGAQVLFEQVTVVPGTDYTVTIGAGGGGVALINGAGNAGGNTTFGALATFPGGAGGTLAGTLLYDHQTKGAQPGVPSVDSAGQDTEYGFGGAGTGNSTGGGASYGDGASFGGSAAANTGGGGGGAHVFDNGGNGGSGILEIYYPQVREA